MKIKPIETEEDYLNTLNRIDELMDAVSDTPELDVLITLVETYEKKIL